MGSHSYFHMYKDVRAAVDLCHRVGTLKQMVANDPRRYINEDSSIVPMFQMLRASCLAVFSVTSRKKDGWCVAHSRNGQLGKPNILKDGNQTSSMRSQAALAQPWIRLVTLQQVSLQVQYFHNPSCASKNWKLQRI